MIKCGTDIIEIDRIKAAIERTPSFLNKAFTEKENLVFASLKGLRDSTVWAYKTSKEIGEKVLAYDPVPGMQKGCIPLSETNGKAWSL